MAFSTLGDLFKNRPDIIESMEDVARKSFPGKFPSEYGGELTSEQIEALNKDPKLLDEFLKNREASAPVSSELRSTAKSTSDILKGERTDQLVKNLQRSSETPNVSSKLDQVDEMSKGIQSESRLANLVKKINELPEASSKLGPIAKLGKYAGPVAEAAGVASAVSDYPESVRKMEQSPTLKQQIGGGLESLGNAALISSPAAGLIGTPLAAAGFATAGLGLKGAGQYLSQPEAPEQQSTVEPLSEEELAALSGPNSSPYSKPEAPKGIGPLADASKYAAMLPKQPQAQEEPEQEEAPQSASTASAQPDQDRLNRLLASPDTVGTLERLRAAQQNADDRRLNADLMAQGNKIGANLAGVISKLGPSKVDTELADKLRADADRPVKNLGEQLEMEKDDPTSAYSKNFREFAAPLAKEIGITLPSNMSARQITSVIPQLQRMYDASQKRDELKLKGEELKQSKEATLDLRKKAISDRLENQVNNRFDKNTKDEVGRIQSADRVMSIINAVKNGALIDSNTIRNTITNDVSILAMPIGSRGTLSDREKTAINTLSTKLKDAELYLSDNPTKTIPPKMLAQLEAEVNLLKGKYVKALEQKTKSLKAGTNDETAKELLDARAQEYMKPSEEHSEEAPAAEQEIITAPNGKKYLVDHKTKQVIKEVK